MNKGSIALARSLCYEIAGPTDENDDMSGSGYGSVAIAEILSAEVERLRAAGLGAWLPIETAPKDGTKILVFTIHGEIEIGEWCVIKRSHYEPAMPGFFRLVEDPPDEFWNNNYPKFWMPLPEAPDIQPEDGS